MLFASAKSPSSRAKFISASRVWKPRFIAHRRELHTLQLIPGSLFVGPPRRRYMPWPSLMKGVATLTLVLRRNAPASPWQPLCPYEFSRSRWRSRPVRLRIAASRRRAAQSCGLIELSRERRDSRGDKQSMGGLLMVDVTGAALTARSRDNCLSRVYMLSSPIARLSDSHTFRRCLSIADSVS